MGLLCGLAGIVIGGYVGLTAIGESYELFPLFAGIAAFLTGAILWWLLMERPAKFSLLSGSTIPLGAVFGGWLGTRTVKK